MFRLANRVPAKIDVLSRPRTEEEAAVADNDLGLVEEHEDHTRSR